MKELAFDFHSRSEGDPFKGNLEDYDFEKSQLGSHLKKIADWISFTFLVFQHHRKDEEGFHQ